MHELESFALSCGSKIDKPFIEQNYFPLVDKKFICISQASSTPSRSYSFFNDVLFHINPFLEKEGISIIQLGDAPQQLFGVKSFPSLNVRQFAYLINKSLLYFGNYNLYTHIACYFDKPVVCPHNYDYLDTFKPYWSNENCSILMEKIAKKPSFSAEENPKTIDAIKPEVIAKSILDKLNIKNNLSNINTIQYGNNYGNAIIDLVPGKYNPNNFNLAASLNLRLDKNFDLNFLLACSKLSNINVVTDKIIPLNYINSVSSAISSISFEINNSTTIDDVVHMSQFGKTLNLFTKDKKNLNEIRLKFLEYNIHEYQNFSRKDIDSKDLKNLYFLSSRNVIIDGVIYNSYLSASKQKNVDKVKSCQEFWEDFSYLRIYSKTS